MDERRINDKLDKLSEDVTDIKVTLAAQHETLKEHMRRSLANESAVEHLKTELAPIHSHVLKVNFLATLAGGVAGVIGFVYLCLQLAQLLMH